MDIAIKVKEQRDQPASTRFGGFPDSSQPRSRERGVLSSLWWRDSSNPLEYDFRGSQENQKSLVCESPHLGLKVEHRARSIGQGWMYWISREN